MDKPQDPTGEKPLPQHPTTAIEPTPTQSLETDLTNPFNQAETLSAATTLSAHTFLYGRDSAFTPLKDRWQWVCGTSILTLLVCLLAYQLQYENLLGGTLTQQIKHARSQERLSIIQQRIKKQSNLDAMRQRTYVSLIALRRADLYAKQLQPNDAPIPIIHYLKHAQFIQAPEYSLIVTDNILDTIQYQTQLAFLTPTMHLLGQLEHKLTEVNQLHARRVRTRLNIIRQHIFFSVVNSPTNSLTSIATIATLHAKHVPTHHPLHRLITAATSANQAEAFIKAVAWWYLNASLKPPQPQLASLTLFPNITLGALFLTPTHFPDGDITMPRGASAAIALLSAFRQAAFAPTPNIHEVFAAAHTISHNTVWRNTVITQKWLPRTVAALITQRRWSTIPSLRTHQANGPYKGAIAWWTHHMADVQLDLENTHNPSHQQAFAAFSKQYDDSIRANARVKAAEQRANQFIKAALNGTINSGYLEIDLPRDQPHIDPQQQLGFQMHLIKAVFQPLLTYNGNSQQILALSQAEENLLTFIASYLPSHLVTHNRSLTIGRNAIHPLYSLKIDLRQPFQTHNQTQNTLTLNTIQWAHLEDIEIDWWDSNLLSQPYFALLQEIATCLWFAQQHELQRQRKTLEVFRSALHSPSLLCPGQLHSGACTTQPYNGITALALLIYRRLPLLVQSSYYNTWWITKKQNSQSPPAWMAFQSGFPLQLARTDAFTQTFGIAPSFHDDFFASLKVYYSIVQQEIEQFSRTPSPYVSLPETLITRQQALFAYGIESTVGKGLLTLVASEAFLQAAIQNHWYPDQPITSFSTRSKAATQPLDTALDGQLETAFRAIVPTAQFVSSQEALQILRKLNISQQVLWWNQIGINALDMAHRSRLYSFFLGMKYGRGKLWNNTPFDISLYPNFDYVNAYQQNRQEIEPLVMDLSHTPKR